MTTPCSAADDESRRSGPLSRVLTHSLPRFLVSGAASVAVDMGILFLLHGVFDVLLPLATFLAVTSSYFVNFTLNRVWSFGSTQARPAGQAFRYLLLAGLNWVLTVGLVSGLAALGVFYLLAKLLTVGINAVINYVAYRFWVFPEGADVRPAVPAQGQAARRRLGAPRTPRPGTGESPGRGTRQDTAARAADPPRSRH